MLQVDICVQGCAACRERGPELSRCRWGGRPGASDPGAGLSEPGGGRVDGGAPTRKRVVRRGNEASSQRLEEMR